MFMNGSHMLIIAIARFTNMPSEDMMAGFFCDIVRLQGIKRYAVGMRT